MEDKKPVNRYSMAFKLRVVDDVESGLLNAEEARRLYGIGGRNTVHEWIAQYGKNIRIGKKVYIMTQKEENELLRLKRENNYLKKCLENALVKELTLESLIEVVQEEYGVDLKKKINSKLLDEARKKLNNLESDLNDR
jgi:transposase-like protein